MNLYLMAIEKTETPTPKMITWEIKGGMAVDYEGNVHSLNDAQSLMESQMSGLSYILKKHTCYNADHPSRPCSDEILKEV